jgi:hypothetical protein
MNDIHKPLELTKIQSFLKGSNITVIEFLDNSKASEYYVRTKFVQDDGFTYTTIVPYEYRRTGLELRSEKDIADYLKSVKKYFTKTWMKNWADNEKKQCLEDIENKKKKNEDKISRGKKPTEIVTPYFLLTLLTLEETSGDKLPPNRNPQRRLQDLKDGGYTIPIVQYGREKTTSTLLPFPKHKEMGYEKGFTKQFKARVIRLLKQRNAFEARVTSAKSLIPDHKFSEVRWDDETKAENSMDMTDAEIVQKFQLLDNQRNQQKREVCRKCFQEGIRGTIYGIDYFYQGDELWDSNIPTKGKAAEKGCIGCPWYDIELWRKMLNKHI